MGTRNHPGLYDCTRRAEPDEPRFALLGRDPTAGALIRQWAWLRMRAIDAGLRPESDRDQVQEAIACAEAADAFAKQWARRKAASKVKV